MEVIWNVLVKLSMIRKKYKKKPLLVACDVYRPAAINQLEQLGKELNMEVYSEGKNNPVGFYPFQCGFTEQLLRWLFEAYGNG